jgi:hypothetical protein
MAKELPQMYLAYKGNDRHYGDDVCTRCGRSITEKHGGKRVQLELDQWLNEYHDFGGVNPEHSQGWFDFGPSCAEKLRQRARAAIAAVPLEVQQTVSLSTSIKD